MGSNMMLTIGAILLFGLFLSSSNRMMIGNNQIASQNEYYITGMSLAQSIIDEAKTKAFDQSTVNADTAVVARSSMTAPGSLGPGAGETVPSTDTLSSLAPYSSTNKGYMSAVKFNDVDDYNKYTRRVNTPRAEGYVLTVTVNYATETNPDNVEIVRTYCKKMTVQVTSPYFPKAGTESGPSTLTVFYAFTY